MLSEDSVLYHPVSSGELCSVCCTEMSDMYRRDSILSAYSPFAKKNDIKLYICLKCGSHKKSR